MTHITRYEKEKELIEDWKLDKTLAFSLVPGTIKNALSFQSIAAFGLTKSNATSLMCSTQAGKQIEKNYGKAKGSVSGKYGKAKFFSFLYKQEVIVCLSEGGDVGTSWYWLPLKEGSRYNNPMLLSHDKKVKDFWPDFCRQIKEELQVSNEHITDKKGISPKM
jgi:hypothetical protein